MGEGFNEEASAALKPLESISRYRGINGGVSNRLMDQFSHDPNAHLAADDPARNRHEARDSLFLMADFRTVGSASVQHVRVRNLSAGGLMAEFAAGLPQGLDVEFDVRGIGWVPGKVAWSAAGRVGIAFAYQIDPMLARKPVGGGAGKGPVSFKPSLTRR